MKKSLAVVILLTVLLSACTWFKKEPQEAVTDGFKKHLLVEKASSEFSLKGVISNVPGETPAKIDLNITSSGVSDMSDEDAPKSDVSFKVAIGIDGSGGAGEVLLRVVDKKVYINVADIQIFGESGAQLKEDLKSSLNKWWSVPLEDKGSFFGISTEQKELKEKLGDTVFFVNAQEEAGAVAEEVHGVKTTKYRVEIDKKAIQSFIVELIRTMGTPIDPDGQKALEESLNDVEFSGAVWIGESDDTLHRLSGTITINPKQGATSSFDVDYQSWDYGEDVVVTTPPDAQEFNNLMLFPLLNIINSAALKPAVEEEPAVDEPLGSSQVKP